MANQLGLRFSRSLMFLRQAYHCYFGLAFMFHTVGQVIDHLYVSMMSRHCVDIMKLKGLHIRISDRRLNKLKLYAASKEKTMTQLIEDWIDRLPTREIDDSSTTTRPNQADD